MYIPIQTNVIFDLLLTTPTMKLFIFAILTSFFLLSTGCSQSAQNRLHLYNWSDSFPPDVIKAFEKETGITVVYDNFDNNDTLEAKLLLGISGYDLVFPSAWPYFSRQARAGFYQKLDRTKLNFLNKLSPALLDFFNKDEAGHDEPGIKYGVPYTWGVIGFAYNPLLIKDVNSLPLNSFAAIYEVANLKKLARCGVSFPEEALDIFPYMMRYMKTQSLGKAVKRFRKLRPYIQRFELMQSVQDLASGSLCFAQTSLSAAIKLTVDLKRTNNPMQIRMSLPKEGIPLWMDVMAIPRNAPHPDNAYKFMNFIYRPENIAKISEHVFEFNLRDDADSRINPQLRKIKKHVLSQKNRFAKINVSDHKQIRTYNKALEHAIFTP